jgi:hypothetical protein
MFRHTAPRRAFFSIPAVAATALIVALIAAPVSASAVPTPRSSGAGTSVVATFLQHALVQKSHIASGAETSEPRQALLPCTFNGASTVVPNVTPGETIAVSCSGFLANETVVLGEGSPLTVVVDEAQGVNEIDVNDVDTVTSSGSGTVVTNFVVPSPFVAPDPAASCPATQTQVNSGLADCLLVVTDASGNVGGVELAYTGEATLQPAGYQEVASDGGIFSFGPPFYGSEGGKPLVKPIVGMAFDPDTGGYWEVASDGGIFSFNAPFEGSEGGKPLVKPIVAIVADPTTGGYWEVASDGGIFSFGNAPFFGSMGGKPLDKPVVGMAYDSNTGGYWEVASDGGIFSFHAPFEGSEGGKPLDKPIVAMADDSGTGGYWEVASDGGLFAFNAPFGGSEGGKPLDKPIVGMSPALIE